MDYQPVQQNDNNLSESLLDNGGAGGGKVDHSMAGQESGMMQTVMIQSSMMGPTVSTGGGGGGAAPPIVMENHTIEVNPEDAGPPMYRGQGLRGEAQQGTHYRDAPFAIAFIAHFLIMLFLAFSWGTSSLNATFYNSADDDSTTDSNDDQPVYVSDDEMSSGGGGGLARVFYWCLLTSFIGVGISAGSLDLLTKHAEQLIQLSLYASCGALTFMVFIMFAQGAELVAFFFIFILLLTGLYAYSVWHRIPFAAANLTTGLAAIQKNYGVCLVGYAVCFATCIWIVIWMLAFMGVGYKEHLCSTDGSGNTVCSVNGISFVLLALSFFWTSQVFKNVLHVTIAGVVGTWWFAPQDANSMCSPAITDSLRRATTYSFGSICFGSLLVAIIQTLEQMAHAARRHGNNRMILCVIECILHYIQHIVKYFNKWSYIYVGLYGYDYLTAGQKVLQLFQERGWTTIISDNLVSRVLSLVCVVIGGTTGLVGMILARFMFGKDGSTVAFGVGFLIGMSLAIVILSVVQSAVNTVIVSFAEAPSEFQSNHPALSQQMMTAWRQVYPEECGF